MHQHDPFPFSNCICNDTARSIQHGTVSQMLEAGGRVVGIVYLVPACTQTTPAEQGIESEALPRLLVCERYLNLHMYNLVSRLLLSKESYKYIQKGDWVHTR